MSTGKSLKEVILRFLPFFLKSEQTFYTFVVVLLFSIKIPNLYLFVYVFVCVYSVDFMCTLYLFC